MKGHKHTAETKARWSALRKGRPGTPHTPESRAKISQARKSPDRDSLLAARLQRCGKCRKVKDLSDFYKNSRNPSGRNLRCIECVKAAPVNRDGRVVFAAFIRRQYKITVEDWARAFHAQDGHCAACREVLTDGGNGCHTDHCHATGRFRGLLCGPCNTAAGSLKDSPTIARALADYLERT